MTTEAVSTQPGSAARLEGMLGDGLIAPPGTPLGEGREQVTARVYRHPGISGDAPVVRLVGEILAPGEDSAMAGLGFGAPAHVEEVGVGKPRALRFPHWAYVHAPEHARYAVAVAKRLDALRTLARKKPKKLRRPINEIAMEVENLAPVLLCAYLEEAARLVLEVGDSRQAARLLTQARRAADASGLVLGPDEKYALLLEFAQAGALDAAIVSDYLNELRSTCPADVAYTRYRRITVERVVHGQVPVTQMPGALERLAKRAAGAGAGGASVEQDVELCLELLDGAAIGQASIGFWRGLRPILVRAAAAEPAIRGRLLDLMPAMPRTRNEVGDAYWLSLLADCGVWESLTEPADAVPASARPGDGAAGWLGRFARNTVRNFYYRYSSLDPKPRQICPPEVVDLLERMAPRLIAEGVPAQLCARFDTHVDLLDRALVLGIPVANPPGGAIGRNHLREWGRPGQSDLTGIAADVRFHPYLVSFVKTFLDKPNRSARQVVWMHVAGLAPLIAEWLRAKAAHLDRCGPFELERQLAPFQLLYEYGFSPYLHAADPEAWQSVHRRDYVPHVLGVLRRGLFDELGWPALEDACEELEPFVVDKRDRPTYRVHDQWPYLVVDNGKQAVVVGHDKIVHRADLPPLPQDQRSQHIMRWTQGSLEVEFIPASRVSLVNGSVELPGGARSFGAEPVRAGETQAPWRGPVATDGTSYWTREHTYQSTGCIWRPDFDAAWHAFDPWTGAFGDEGQPEFFSRAFTDGGIAERFGDAAPAPYACELKTMPDHSGPSPLGQAGPLVGWRAVIDAEDVQAGVGVDGRQVDTVRPPLKIGSDHRPTVVGALRYPGATVDLAVVFHFARRHTDGYKITLVDPEGRVHAFLKQGAGLMPQAQGTRCIPPWQLWHLLTPRDPAGSAALRGIDETTVRALIEEFDATDFEGRLEVVARLLPEVTHPRLRRGIRGALTNILYVRDLYYECGESAQAKGSDHEH